MLYILNSIIKKVEVSRENEIDVKKYDGSHRSPSLSLLFIR
jgi:hypothetical protein